MRIKLDDPRTTVAELSDLIPEMKIKRVAKNLSEEKIKVMANLYGCLLNVEHKLPKKKYKIFDLKEDIGIKKLQIGTPGGGYYGPYRMFRVKFRDEEFLVGLGMNRYINKKRSILCVAIERDGEKPHHSLQLAVDKYMTIEKRSCFFTHNGDIGLGALGSGKHKILREEYVEPIYPNIIEGRYYSLGKIGTDRLWYMNGRTVVKFVENMISYGIVRDLYRQDAIKKAEGKS